MSTDSQCKVAVEFGYELSLIKLASSRQNFTSAADFLEFLDDHVEELKEEMKKMEKPIKQKTTSSLREETECLYRFSCCAVCVQRQRNIVVLPCGHFALCDKCEKRCLHCPIKNCNCLILDVIHTYLI